MVDDRLSLTTRQFVNNLTHIYILSLSSFHFQHAGRVIKMTIEVTALLHGKVVTTFFPLLQF